MGHELLTLAIANGPHFRLTRVSLVEAAFMDVLTLQQAIADAYRAVFDHLDGWHAVRFWAFIPEIHADMGAGLDRYMAFNAGRYAACSAHFGSREAFGWSLPTGSAVGVRGRRDLQVYCLSSAAPGRPVENPRQVPAYLYSRRYGPLPPCFARATGLPPDQEGRALLLVGGTASIRGEDSLHSDDIEAQLEETLRNLASVVRAASLGNGALAASEQGDGGEWLARFRELRVYYLREQHEDGILDKIATAFRQLARVELAHSQLCRNDLLVEMEGTAIVDHANVRG